jgi:argininosuccinate lyase
VTSGTESASGSVQHGAPAGTGRLVGELGLGTRRVIYGEPTPAELEAELTLMVKIDRAHLVMLAEQRLIPAAAVVALLRCIDELAADSFRPLLGRPMPRGLYLMYEGYLIERLGPEIGGVLHSGRSRNDLKATITSLRCRDRVLDLAMQTVRLEAALLSRARAYRSVVMPIYTHFQAAMPITYGYYLLGVALAVGREIDALRSASAGLRECPLGAGAVAGTDLPIDPARTAALLGYAAPTRHALDAVASRDVLLRVLGAAAGLAVTLSRLGTDLQLWSTTEFGFIQFPDRLVGGSSAMPQKRNAFLTEHVKAKPGQALGAWAAAAAAMSATPFTNSIEVGTEAVASVWSGLQAAEESVLLCQALVSGARPVPERMAGAAEAGFTVATSLANRLVRHGVPFRTAHHQVGEAVRRAIEAGSTNLAKFGPPGWLDQLDDAALDPAELVEAHRHGGGPGAFDGPCRQVAAAWVEHRDWQRDWRLTLAGADAALATAVRSALETGDESGRTRMSDESGRTG